MGDTAGEVVLSGIEKSLYLLNDREESGRGEGQ